MHQAQYFIWTGVIDMDLLYMFRYRAQCSVVMQPDLCASLNYFVVVSCDPRLDFAVLPVCVSVLACLFFCDGYELSYTVLCVFSNCFAVL